MARNPTANANYTNCSPACEASTPPRMKFTPHPMRPVSPRCRAHSFCAPARCHTVVIFLCCDGGHDRTAQVSATENLPCLPNRRNPSHRDAGQACLSMYPMRYDDEYRQVGQPPVRCYPWFHRHRAYYSFGDGVGHAPQAWLAEPLLSQSTAHSALTSSSLNFIGPNLFAESSFIVAFSLPLEG